MSVRIRKICSFLLVGVFVATFSSAILTDTYFLCTRPDTAQPDEQRTFPERLGHGSIRYLTADEDRFFKLLTNVGIPVSMAIGVVGCLLHLNATRAGIDEEIDRRERAMETGSPIKRVKK